MQKVERRKHKALKHRRLTGLILCALLLAGCVTAAVLLRRNAEEEPAPARQRIAGSITKRPQDDLASLTLIRRDGESWTVVREKGELRLQQAESGILYPFCRGDQGTAGYAEQPGGRHDLPFH